MERGERMSIESLFQTIAGNVGTTYSDLLADQEFRNAVDKIMKSAEYEREHDNQSMLIAKNNLKENDNG